MSIFKNIFTGMLSTLTIIALVGFNFLAGGTLAFAYGEEIEVEIYDDYAEIFIFIEEEDIDEDDEVDFTDEDEIIEYIADEYDLDEDYVEDIIEFEYEDEDEDEDDEDEDFEEEIEVEIYDDYAEIFIFIEEEDIDEDDEVDFTDEDEIIEYIADEYDLDEDYVEDIIEFEYEDEDEDEEEDDEEYEDEEEEEEEGVMSDSDLNDILTDPSLYTDDPQETAVNIFTAIFVAVGFPEGVANLLARAFMSK